jgi:photosystem II stability/assembly factor-like uncharacterized protein
MKLGASTRGTGCLLLVAAFFFGTCNAARAQERVAAIKMLAPGVGWAIKGSGLFWTSNNGAQWTDITPPIPPLGQLASVFFLDSNTGWALIAKPGDPLPEFELASTNNAGATWSTTPITVPHWDPLRQPPLLASGSITFADSLNGWMVIPVEAGSAFRGGGARNNFGRGSYLELGPRNSYERANDASANPRRRLVSWGSEQHRTLGDQRWRQVLA